MHRTLRPFSSHHALKHRLVALNWLLAGLWFDENQSQLRTTNRHRAVPMIRDIKGPLIVDKAARNPNLGLRAHWTAGPILPCPYWCAAEGSFDLMELIINKHNDDLLSQFWIGQDLLEQHLP